MIGRAAELDALDAELGRSRLVTVQGRHGRMYAASSVLHAGG